MAKLSTQFMGMELKNPVLGCARPLDRDSGGPAGGNRRRRGRGDDRDHFPGGISPPAADLLP